MSSENNNVPRVVLTVIAAKWRCGLCDEDNTLGGDGRWFEPDGVKVTCCFCESVFAVSEITTQ
jgi:hypothetical protein